MNEAPQAVQHSARHAEVKATHFNSKGEVLFNPQKEQPKPVGKLEGVLRALRREQLPQQPEGPKHVLETLNEIGLMERSDKATEGLYNAAKDGVKQNLGHDHKAFYSTYGSTKIYLDVIAQAKAVRTEAAKGTAVPELVQTPSAIQQIFQEVNPSNNATDNEIVQIRILKRHIQFKSRSGVRINLTIPDGSKPIETSSNHLGLAVESDRPTDISETALKNVAERYSNKDSLLDITDTIVKYVEDVGQILPVENDEQGAVLKQKDKMMEDSQKWLVSYSKIKSAQKEIVPEENMAKSPAELAEKMKDPRYLPSRNEISKAFDNSTKQEFNEFCDKNNIYEFFNQEYVASLSDYLVRSIGKAQEALYLKEIRPITVLEVGAGNGKLMFHLQQKMREMGLREDQVKFVATDDKSWDDGKTSEPAMEVENLDADKSVKKYKPDIVIFSWMPPNTDLSQALRQDGVGEYILIGERGGVTGGNETWGINSGEVDDYVPGYEKDGFQRVDLEPSGDEEGIIDGQIARNDEPPFSTGRSGTTSFRRV